MASQHRTSDAGPAVNLPRYARRRRAEPAPPFTASKSIEETTMLNTTDQYQDIRDAVRDLCAQFPDEYSPQDRRGARLSRSLRRCADQGRLARRDDPAGIRRLGPGPGRGFRDHGGDQPLRRQLRRLPRPDVQHGHAAAPRLRGAEAAVPAQDRHRRTAPAVDGRHRAHAPAPTPPRSRPRP